MNFKSTLTGAPNKILIIRLSSIGDILLSTPFIRQVRNRFPNAQIDFVIKDLYKDLLRYNPHIDKLHSVPLNQDNRELSQLKEELRRASYHIVFDLHNNIRSNYLKRFIHADSVHSIEKGKLKQSLLVWFKINTYNNEIPIPGRYLNVAKEFDIEDDGKGLEIYWNNNTITIAEKKASSQGMDLNKPFLGLVPGAGFYTKRWPKEKFVKLIDLLRQNESQIVVFGGEKDVEIGSYLKIQKDVISLCGELTLLETAYLISKGKILVSNDSGLMHMATAVQTPVLAIFGSTVKELGFFPYRSISRVVENMEISCRPCSHIGRHKCPKGHFRCMEDISPERVYVELKRFI